MNSSSNQHTPGRATPEPRAGVNARDNRLGAALLNRGWITQEQLEAALATQREGVPRRLLGAVLVQEGALTPERLARALAEVFKVPFLTLTPELVSPADAAVLPRAFMERHNVLPLYLSDGVLVVAVEVFTDILLIDEIGRTTGHELVVVAADPDAIRGVRHATLGPPPDAGDDTASSQDQPLSEVLAEIGVDDLQIVERTSETVPDLEANASDSPTVKLLNYVIKTGLESGASDIHVEPLEGRFRVRYRVDGDLFISMAPPSRLLPALISRIKILSGMDISERRLPQDGGMCISMQGRCVDIRVSTMLSRFGEKVVMRILDRDVHAMPLGSIGMPPGMLDRFRSLVSEPNGLVLVTGPTGSGKSTTLYGALAEIVSDLRNVSTIEDPVERVVPGVNQFQVHAQAGLTFARVLRSMLRQDPDVIMVGEIRDPETAKLATEASLTGHLVLSTLHTNDAPTAVPRLVNMGIEPYLVAASLRGVLAQRLVGRVCPACVTTHQLTDAQALALQLLCGGECPIGTASSGLGCAECRHTGTRGRTGVYDLMIVSEPTALKLIEDPRSVSAMRGAPDGLLLDGIEKVKAGIIGLDSLLRIVMRTQGGEADTPCAMRAAA